jgi:hypothetical protein
MTSSRSSSIAIAAGVAVGAAWLALMEATVRFIPEASPWRSTVSAALTSLGPIIPGFAAGLVAARRGFTVGAVASVLTSILWSIYVNFMAPHSVMDSAPAAVIPDEVTFALVAVLVGGICGIAGATLAKERWQAL